MVTRGHENEFVLFGREHERAAGARLAVDAERALPDITPVGLLQPSVQPVVFLPRCRRRRPGSPAASGHDVANLPFMVPSPS